MAAAAVEAVADMAAAAVVAAAVDTEEAAADTEAVDTAVAAADTAAAEVATEAVVEAAADMVAVSVIFVSPHTFYGFPLSFPRFFSFLRYPDPGIFTPAARFCDNNPSKIVKMELRNISSLFFLFWGYRIRNTV